MIRDWGEEVDACDEFVLSAYEYYSIDTVAELLLPTGLLIDKSTQYAGTFEKFIFLKGNRDEIYTRQEIGFISAVDNMATFTEFHKRTKKGWIPCKVVVTRNSILDPVEFSIAFTKIVNKAIDGFNICVVFSEEGIILTCGAYDSTGSNYCISDIIKTCEQMEELYDDLMYSSKYDVFVEYYSYVRESIQFKGYEEIYTNRVAEADEYLFKIESSRVNTMEMLFEAEEMEKLASEAEQSNETMLMQNTDEEEKSLEEIDIETKAMLNDPESMIQLLKKKRGI